LIKNVNFFVAFALKTNHYTLKTISIQIISSLELDVLLNRHYKKGLLLQILFIINRVV